MLWPHHSEVSLRLHPDKPGFQHLLLAMDVSVPHACQPRQKTSSAWSLCKKHIYSSYSSSSFACSWIGDHILTPCTQRAAVTPLWSTAGLLCVPTLQSWPCLSSLSPLPSSVLTLRGAERRMAQLEREGGESTTVPGLQFFPYLLEELLSSSTTQQTQLLSAMHWGSFSRESSSHISY